MTRLGKCLGSGGCSEVFEWDDKQVVKLFRSNTTLDSINIEFQNSMSAWESGLPVARPYEQVNIDGRPGIIFEKIVGETISERLLAQLSDKDYINFNDEKCGIRMIARLLYEIHKKSVSGIVTSQKDSMKREISWPPYLSDSEKQKIIEHLDNLPTENFLCHGDPNPGNIMMRDENLVMLDWMSTTMGNPISDIAEFILVFKYYVVPSDIPSWIADNFNASREAIIKIFLDEYMKLSGIKYEDIDAWILPVAARKLSGDAVVEEEKSMLMDVIRRRL